MAILTNKQFAVLAVGAVAGVYYLGKKGDQVKDSLNPASPDNLVNRGVTRVVGGGDMNLGAVRIGKLLDPVFARGVIANPFASEEAKARARNVLLLASRDDG